jgi:predicted phosphodiesterase
LRVAVLADVHGNLPALEAVLVDIEREGFDTIVSLGDLVSGPRPVECLERVAALDPVWVIGNADRYAADPPEDAWPADLHAHEQLSPEQRAELLAWPLTAELDGVLYCHGTPRSDEEVVTKLTPPERLAGILVDVAAPLVVGGHTHHQFTLPRWVNAGSIGMPYEDQPGAYWLAVIDGEPRFRRSAYDGAPRPEATADEAAAQLEPT